MRWMVCVALSVVACEAPKGSATQVAPLAEERKETCTAAPLPGVKLEDGTTIEVRQGDEPGESGLWVVPADGGPAAPLAPAPGPDEHPIALGGRRVAFVSGRSTVASLWVVDLDSGEAVQLTNRGLEAGGGLEGFVPPPAGEVHVAGGALEYDDGYGEKHRVALAPKEAAR